MPGMFSTPLTTRMIAALLVAECLWALDPSIAISQYAKKHWQVEDGLPQNYVTSVSQCPDGYLLVGTSGGVARFDGLRFTPLALNPGKGISREWINAVQATPDGSIWVASRDDGAHLFPGGWGSQPLHWKQTFVALLATRGGKILGLGEGGIWTWDRTGIRNYARATAFPDLSWHPAAELPDGSIAVPLEGTAGAGGRLHLLPASSRSYGIALSVHEAREGGVWMGTTRGLFRVAPGAPPRISPAAGVPGPVVSIVEDRDGVVWAATWGYGLYRLTPHGASAWTVRDGLPDNFVHNVFEDAEGNLWIGTRAGLSRWKSTPIIPYGPPEGLGGQFFSAITGDPGGIWLGTWRSGLYRMARGHVDKLDLPEPSLKVLIRAIAVAPGGALWVSDWTGLLERQRRGWKRYPAGDSGYVSPVHSIAFDRHGGLWLGAESGLHHYPGGWPAPGAAPMLAYRAVKTLLIDWQDRVWAGTSDGLFVVEQGRASRVRGVPHATVTSLSSDSVGHIWATTRANGLCRITPAGVRFFDDRHGLPALPFYAALDDGSGWLWLSSPAGVYAVPLAQIEELSAGRRERLEPIRYTQEDGLRTTECQNVGQPPAWKDSSGSLWFPTVRGVVRIQPHQRRDPPPRVVVESVESTARSHLVTFTAPRLASPERLEFRYRVDDGGAEWVPAGTERTLRYSNLPAGHHRLNISARESGGDWGPPAVLELAQPPRFYETWWFAVVCLGLGAGLLYIMHRSRVLLLRDSYRPVLAERNRIAREWHDTLLAGFSAMGWQLDSTLLCLRESPERAAEAVEVARSMLQHYRSEARRVIWDLRGSELESQSLEKEIRSAIAEITRERQIETSVNVEGEPVPLPRNVAHNLLRICQEAATNSVRHGAPARVDVRLRFDATRVEAAVQDDGTGFEPEMVPDGHFGLEIIRERVRHFGGEMAICSRKGGGTTVTASIPYPRFEK